MGQLPSVVDVVPDTVEAAGDAYDRGQEGVAHPNGEDRVLLSQALRTADWASGSLADAPADPKLQYATEQGRQGDTRQYAGRRLGVVQTSGRHGYGQCERNRPQAKRQSRKGADTAVQAWPKSTK